MHVTSPPTALRRSALPALAHAQMHADDSHAHYPASGAYAPPYVAALAPGSPPALAHATHASPAYAPLGYPATPAAPAYPPFQYAQPRSASPPVVLAPIQTDRLVRGPDALPTPLPALASTTGSAGAYGHAVARGAPAQMEVYQQHQQHQHQHSQHQQHQHQQQQHQQHQQQHSHQHQHSPAGHESQVPYSYASSYSSLSPGSGHHASWRPEVFRRSSLTAV